MATTTLFLFWKYKWGIGDTEAEAQAGTDEIVEKVKTQNFGSFGVERTQYLQRILKVLPNNSHLFSNLTTGTHLGLHIATSHSHGMVQEHVTYRVKIILFTMAVITTLFLGIFVGLFVLGHNWQKTNGNEGHYESVFRAAPPELDLLDDLYSK